MSICTLPVATPFSLEESKEFEVKVRKMVSARNCCPHLEEKRGIGEVSVISLNDIELENNGVTFDSIEIREIPENKVIELSHVGDGGEGITHYVMQPAYIGSRRISDSDDDFLYINRFRVDGNPVIVEDRGLTSNHLVLYVANLTFFLRS
jgi:hypothetical protein